ncbi:D-TA family PLP-dependent enzyme [Rhodopirellula bahusiensis]|uniref:D-TA family PLP-dependent enzyme n=1 Tax=Rhodopirellula bahusiensis TaxID=2014065 RepID=UPI003266FAAE
MNSKHWIDRIRTSSQTDPAPWYEVEDVDQVFSPALLIYPDRVQANLDRMIEMAGGADRLRPHVKTHKMPAVVEMNIAAGITRFKAATIAEAEMTAAAGAKDVLLAVQPVGPNIQRFVRLVESYPSCEFSCLVDDSSILTQLETEFRAANVQGRVWLDLDVGMNRTGIAPSYAATELVRLIDASKHVRLAGLHVYDGHLHDTDTEHLKQQFDESTKPFWDWFGEVQRNLGHTVMLVAGGTPTSTFWQAESRSRNVESETGAGTTVLWDAGQPTFSPAMPFEPAALVMTRVISRPTEFDVCLDLGHKAVASEMPLPRVKWLNFDADHEVVGHNEEHMVLRMTRPSPLRCGDVLYGIPVHICPTVALHQHAECVKDHRVIEKWPVVARNRTLTI